MSAAIGLAMCVEFDVDDEMRAAAFLYLDRQRAVYGDRIPWRVLQAFEHDGQRRALITQRGIRWVSGMPALTFTTTYSPDPTRAPYADGVGVDGFPRYKYQGTEPARADNVSMKLANRLGKPLIWFVGTGEGVHAATYPTPPADLPQSGAPCVRDPMHHLPAQARAAARCRRHPLRLRGRTARRQQRHGHVQDPPCGVRPAPHQRHSRGSGSSLALGPGGVRRGRCSGTGFGRSTAGRSNYPSDVPSSPTATCSLNVTLASSHTVAREPEGTAARGLTRPWVRSRHPDTSHGGPPVTERKPAGMPFESWVERQILDAQKRGEFDHLPGAGKPLPGLTGQYDEMWWVKQLAQRERVSTLPPMLAMRKEAEDLLDGLANVSSEALVRDLAEDYNARAVEAIRRLQDGPLFAVPRRLAVDEVLAEWGRRRAARNTPAGSQTVPTDADERGRSTRPRLRLWHRARRAGSTPDG